MDNSGSKIANVVRTRRSSVDKPSWMLLRILHRLQTVLLLLLTRHNGHSVPFKLACVLKRKRLELLGPIAFFSCTFTLRSHGFDDMRGHTLAGGGALTDVLVTSVTVTAAATVKGVCSLIALGLVQSLQSLGRMPVLVACTPQTRVRLMVTQQLGLTGKLLGLS